ncbi:MAG TPA: hypothetical protein VKE74_01255, partial [Gemmataceae bacterium]|nr:hypothetical protein [Gemmataceae bacterium]
MRRFRWPVVVLLVLLVGLPFLLAGLGVRIPWLSHAPRLPQPSDVPDGDQEIAWINPPTEAGTWDEFVTGVKRAEMRVPGLVVNVANAFPEQTTAVPEVVLSRPPYPGKLRFRWYKSSSEATIQDWVAALARRNPAPLTVVGGWSSDRAVELATALHRQTGWHGDPPLLLITTATIDKVQLNPNDPEWYAQPGEQQLLTDLHPGRTFRFCFTNSQMAEAVTDYLAHDPTLLPGRGGWPGFFAVPAGAAGAWPAIARLADLAGPEPVVFTLQWEDDPFSEDLADYFKDEIYKQFACRADPHNPTRPPTAPAFVERNRIPFSVGGFSRPNPGEAEAVRDIARQLPPTGERAVLI